MTDHEEYEVLCALAATGQLHEPEKTIFHEHFQHCCDCRDQLQQLTAVSVRLHFEAAVHPVAACMPSGSTERFRARILREGMVPHGAPARQSTSYALASAAAFFVLLSALILIPHEHKSAERVAVFAAAATTPQQRHPAAANLAMVRPPRAPKVVHTLLVRQEIDRRANATTEDTSEVAQRFLHTIPPRYPFFGPPSGTKAARTNYPALSRLQISHPDLFRDLDEASNRNFKGIASPGRPIDIASAGNMFDFAANIRQLHFQLPTAQ